MSRNIASTPLNSSAVGAANNEFYAKHPEMVQDGKRTPLDPNNPAQAGMRHEWMESYAKNKGKAEPVSGKHIKKAKAAANKKFTPKPVAAAVEPCPCQIKMGDLVVICSHGRQAGSSGVLQIVAKTTKAIKQEKTLGVEGMCVAVSHTVESGGSDVISVTLRSGSGCDPKILISGGDFQQDDWESGTARSAPFEVNSHFAQQKTSIGTSLGSVSPVTYTIVGSSIGGQSSVNVEQYPSDQNSYNIKVDGLGFVAEKFNEAFEKWGEEFFGATPIQIVPKILPPVGSFKVTNGWKEEEKGSEDCWRTFYEINCEAGLDPLFGFEVKVELSLGQCAYALVGIPPPVSKLLAKHVADIIVFEGLGIKLKVLGNLVRKEFTSGKIENEGKIVVTRGGEYSIGLTARVGSDYIYSVACTGQAKVALDQENELKISQDKFTFQPSLKLKPIELGVEVKTRSFYVYSESKENTWKLWQEDVDIWKGNELVLLDLNSHAKS